VSRSGAQRLAPALGAAIVAATFVLPCHAGVRKCTEAGGRVVFQDTHCAPAAASAAPAATAGVVVAATAATAPSFDRPKGEAERRDPTAHGAWRGAAQFRYVSGAPPDAGADADIEVALLPDGRVLGGAVAVGCRLDGVHAWQRRTKNVISVDVQISGCRDARFNARYAGLLDATPARSRLRLHAITAASPVTAEGYRDLSMATIDAAVSFRPQAR
jgi:hypothetical protein